MNRLPPILPAPELPDNLPTQAKWLAGEGAGSWFVILEEDMQFRVQRYSPKGMLECSGVFNSDNELNLNEEYKVTYPSHCAKVTLIQYGKLIILKAL